MDNREQLDESIKKKLEGWDRTRHNRMNASERLKGYSETWEVVSLIMNTEAIMFVIMAFTGSFSDILGIVSAAFSCYVILIQYFLATRDYSARSLKMHYEQLEIESLRAKLKTCQILDDGDYHVGEERVKSIIDQYQVSMRGSENHTKIDDDRYKETKNSPSHHVWDWTLDQVLIYFNVVICILVASLIIYAIV